MVKFAERLSPAIASTVFVEVLKKKRQQRSKPFKDATKTLIVASQVIIDHIIIRISRTWSDRGSPMLLHALFVVLLFSRSVPRWASLVSVFALVPYGITNYDLFTLMICYLFLRF